MCDEPASGAALTSVDVLVAAIRSRVESVQRLLVALDGHSTAGKSTLAEVLTLELSIALVHGDDFYADVSDEQRLAYSPLEGVESFFDWRRMRDEALLPLRAGTRARFARYDWNTGHGLTAPVEVEPCAVVVIEGVYAARPELDDLTDLAVLVEASPAMREQRRALRSDQPEMWERWDAAERLYFATIRPRSSFDLIISGES